MKGLAAALLVWTLMSPRSQAWPTHTACRDGGLEILYQSCGKFFQNTHLWFGGSEGPQTWGAAVRSWGAEGEGPARGRFLHLQRVCEGRWAPSGAGRGGRSEWASMEWQRGQDDADRLDTAVLWDHRAVASESAVRKPCSKLENVLPPPPPPKTEPLGSYLVCKSSGKIASAAREMPALLLTRGGPSFVGASLR